MMHHVIKGCGSIKIFGFSFSRLHMYFHCTKMQLQAKWKVIKHYMANNFIVLKFHMFNQIILMSYFLYRSHYMYNMSYQGQTCCVHGVYMCLFLPLLGPNFPTSTHTKFSPLVEQKVWEKVRKWLKGGMNFVNI